MARSPATWVREDDVLVWYFRYSAADLGFAGWDPECIDRPHGQPHEVPLPAGLQPLSVGGVRLTAAAAQAFVRQVLRKLTARDQAVLEACYDPSVLDSKDKKRTPLNMLNDHRAAAGVVHRLRVEHRVEIDRLKHRIRQTRGRQRTEAKSRLSELEASLVSQGVDTAQGAHERFRLAWTQLRDEYRAELDEARREGKAKREALLSELLELPRKERLRANADALLQEMGIEVGP